MLGSTDYSVDYDENGRLTITVKEVTHYHTWEDYHAAGWPTLDEEGSPPPPPRYFRHPFDARLKRK